MCCLLSTANVRWWGVPVIGVTALIPVGSQYEIGSCDRNANQLVQTYENYSFHRTLFDTFGGYTGLHKSSLQQGVYVVHEPHAFCENVVGL